MPFELMPDTVIGDSLAKLWYLLSEELYSTYLGISNLSSCISCNKV